MNLLIIYSTIFEDMPADSCRSSAHFRINFSGLRYIFAFSKFCEIPGILGKKFGEMFEEFTTLAKFPQNVQQWYCRNSNRRKERWSPLASTLVFFSEERLPTRARTPSSRVEWRRLKRKNTHFGGVPANHQDNSSAREARVSVGLRVWKI
jgi:hypothetical protein